MMSNRLLVLALVVAIALPGVGTARDVPPTNLELVEMAARGAVDSIAVGAPQSGRRLHLDTSSANEAVWLLDNLLKEKLIGRGCKIVSDEAISSNQGDSSQVDFELKIQVIELGLHYGRVWRRYLLTGKQVERIARVALYYELVDNTTGDVVKASNTKSEMRDVVPASLLPTLADSKYSFAKPELKKTSWDRYLEGGLVLAIIGVLVYLFYSNKTA